MEYMDDAEFDAIMNKLLKALKAEYPDADIEHAVVCCNCHNISILHAKPGCKCTDGQCWQELDIVQE